MHVFQEVEQALVITSKGGVYRQGKLFTRGGKAYARHGAGYVKLMQGGGTSIPSMSWLEIDPGESEMTEGGGYVNLKTTAKVSAE